MLDCGFTPKDERRRSKSPRLLAIALVLGCVGMFAFMPAAAMATTTSLSGTDVAVENDANHDGIFSDSESVPKNVTYPWTVTYRLTLMVPHVDATVNSLTDNTTGPPLDTASPLSPNCSSLVGSLISAPATVTCYYDATIAQAGSVPLVNTATFQYNGPRDSAFDTSTVNFPNMTVDKTSTTTSVTAAGQIVPYSYLVTNTGTIALTGVSVSDNNVDTPPTCPGSTLAPGTSMTCTAQHTVTLAELTAGGNLVNIATASSNEAPDATDTVSIPIVPPPPPTASGALTMGFWQNKNGQGIITGQAASGICPSGTWLRQYVPFQDLSASATCSAVASYVYNLIKGSGSTCGGSTCNAMLKPQMLATALDVYFSNPALGGNKLGAPQPIGGLTVDLTHVCTDIPTCSTFVNASSAFGSASSLTVLQLLAYASSQSNVGGSVWYGQVKATQVLAKDVFDAINNQVATLL
jgi:hypothetical protein